MVFSVTKSPFGFAVTRIADGRNLFNSTPPREQDGSSFTFRNLVYKDRYLEISTKLNADASIYGLGERRSNMALNRMNQGFSLWDMDRGTPLQKNLYGSHPFYMEVCSDGSAHGVFLANNHGIEARLRSDLSSNEYFLTFRTTGGIFDLFFFAGPTPLAVIQQYHQVSSRDLSPLFPFSYDGF